MTPVLICGGITILLALWAADVGGFTSAVLGAFYGPPRGRHWLWPGSERSYIALQRAIAGVLAALFGLVTVIIALRGGR